MNFPCLNVSEVLFCTFRGLGTSIFTLNNTNKRNRGASIAVFTSCSVKEFEICYKRALTKSISLTKSIIFEHSFSCFASHLKISEYKKSINQVFTFMIDSSEILFTSRKVFHQKHFFIIVVKKFKIHYQNFEDNAQTNFLKNYLKH